MKKQKTFESHTNPIVRWIQCPVCGCPAGLDGTNQGIPSLAWFDPYNKTHYSFKLNKGCYVHYDCLSAQRKKEIENEQSVQKN
jgi:hypothetical protein